MSHEDIYEEIEVTASFQHGKVTFVRLTWQTQTYQPKRMTRTWSVEDGADRQHYFIVDTRDGNRFEIIFDTNKLIWILARAYFED